MGLTTGQKEVLITIERTTASISVISSVILILTYLSFKDFRTLPNTIIFLASPANLLAGVAALIGGSGLDNVDGTTCQAQAFLLEWFMQSDPFWSLVAAVTVFLVFFRRWGAERITNLYWVYILFCYGIPGVAAFVCLLYKKNGPIYGNASLWCWIDQEYHWARIYTYYGPVWGSIVFSLSIYVAVGIRVYQTRSQLNDARNHPYCGTGRSSTIRSPSLLEQATEVQTTDKAPTIKYPDAVYSPTSATSPPATPPSNYTSTLTSTPVHLMPLHVIFRFMSRAAMLSVSGLRQAWKKWKNMDEVKYKYTKCAGLFAISILVTWVPASFNRIYGIIYPDGRYVYALNIASALVLPLQGFWNAVIFFSTSVGIVKMVWGDVRACRRLVLVGKMLGWGSNVQEINVPLAERRNSIVGMGRSNDSQTRLRASTRLDDESLLDSL
ncbi:uncharacterized protein LY89DRAFT_143917 [Mollisia scopiformis]|uniref:G-protein coupled receptors family 2 profile 2 domain-containing protein n=1 Tax=Mollisia scopiformis TaxID=149040 RepID=A0A194X342_MOLSC|nr:uncharacterized protein LY89DRAFT_143917 [Mollisia scopiformis]KUJ14603.1 hypothetical protein LY89DRAFT_143917 [Mollisia scopiformis]